MPLRIAVVLLVLASAAACTSDEPAADPTTSTTGDVPVSTTTSRPGSTTSSGPTGTTTSAAPPDVVTETGVQYTSDLAMDVYGPPDSGEWPIVVLVHDHGAVPADMAPLAEELARRGLLVFVPAWRSGTADPSGLPGGWADVACASRFARTTAPDFGSSARRVTVAGHGLGGAAAAVVALNGDAFFADCLTGGGSVAPDAFVGLDGAYVPASGFPPEVLQAVAAEELDRLSPLEQSASPRRPGVAFHVAASGDPEYSGQSTEFASALEAGGHRVATRLFAAVAHDALIDPATPGLLDLLAGVAVGAT